MHFISSLMATKISTQKSQQNSQITKNSKAIQNNWKNRKDRNKSVRMKWSNLILLPPTTIILTIILCTKALPLTTSRKSNHPKICLLLSMRKMIISKIKGIQTPRNQYKEKNKFPTFSPIKADPSHSFSICSLRNPISSVKMTKWKSRVKVKNMGLMKMRERVVKNYNCCYRTTKTWETILKECWNLFKTQMKARTSSSMK